MKRVKEKTKISRHTLLTIVYTEAGKRLGYSLTESGIAAVTIATGIAVFKNRGGKKNVSRVKQSTSAITVKPTDPFFEHVTFVEIGGFGVAILPNYKGELYTRNRKGEYRKTSISGDLGQFEWKWEQVVYKTPDVYEKILERLENVPIDTLRSRKLFDIYKAIRDEIRL